MAEVQERGVAILEAGVGGDASRSVFRDDLARIIDTEDLKIINLVDVVRHGPGDVHLLVSHNGQPLRVKLGKNALAHLLRRAWDAWWSWGD